MNKRFSTSPRKVEENNLNPKIDVILNVKTTKCQMKKLKRKFVPTGP